jgi:hypothetical protein
MRKVGMVCRIKSGNDNSEELGKGADEADD